ncbi:RnfABCDGE type electron transport complex subunit B [Aestuariirhabdus sp. LZHN29]|uniref:RnfABCDGE type electron transport complex subunit B n=1 Tax=Aestuariirhabdus sp. LZHN29 TaxID=3417462 RepID=UPI003CF74305
MFTAVMALALMGGVLGYLLGIAAIHLRVEEPEIVQELEALLPGTNCGQCGFPGCPAGARALAEGTAPVTLCPPGGKPLAEALAQKLGVELDLSSMADTGPRVAIVVEEQCIGCTRCFKVCPTDAIIGAPKQMHNVVTAACTGCNKCIDICPTMGIEMVAPALTLSSWKWPKPEPDAEIQR